MEGERPRPIVIGEAFWVAPPADHGPQRTVGIFAVEMILELEREPSPRGQVLLPFVEREDAPCRGQLDRALGQFGELKDVIRTLRD